MGKAEQCVWFDMCSCISIPFEEQNLVEQFCTHLFQIANGKVFTYIEIWTNDIILIYRNMVTCKCWEYFSSLQITVFWHNSMHNFNRILVILHGWRTASEFSTCRKHKWNLVCIISKCVWSLSLPDQWWFSVWVNYLVILLEEVCKKNHGQAVLQSMCMHTIHWIQLSSSYIWFG